MQTQTALAHLESLPQETTVAEVYDLDETVRAALIELIPDFEYPDYSHKTISQILNGLINRPY